MSLTPTPRFEIGRVISRLAGVIMRNFLVLATLSLLLSGLPTFLVGLTARLELPLLGIAPLGAMEALPLLNMLISALLQAALIHGTIWDLNGRKPGLAECLTTSFRDVLPLIGISVCTTVAVSVGMLFLIVPGVILALTYCVSAPARVVEKLGVFAAMHRSRELTRNHRWAILVLFVLYVIGQSTVTSLLAMPSVAVGFLLPSGATGLAEDLVIRSLAQSAAALVGAAGVASIYFELRTIKEGVSVEALAAAFD